MTIYYWYDEENDKIWQETKCGPTQATTKYFTATKEKRKIISSD